MKWWIKLRVVFIYWAIGKINGNSRKPSLYPHGRLCLLITNTAVNITITTTTTTTTTMIITVSLLFSEKDFWWDASEIMITLSKTFLFSTFLLSLNVRYFLQYCRSVNEIVYYYLNHSYLTVLPLQEGVSRMETVLLTDFLRILWSFLFLALRAMRYSAIIPTGQFFVYWNISIIAYYSENFSWFDVLVRTDAFNIICQLWLWASSCDCDGIKW
jgi:hypothetical protein